MPKTSREKKKFAITLLDQDLSYEEIQQKLKEKFGTGMSNTTLKNLNEQSQEINFLYTKVQQLEEEVNLWKKMYFELKSVMMNKIKQKKRPEKHETH